MPVNRASIFATAILLFAASAQQAHAAGVVITHSESLQNLAVDRSAARDLPGSLRQAPSTMTFDALGQRFEIELEANHRLASQLATLDPETDVGVYRGKLAGNPRSWARITMVDGVPTGLIWDGVDMVAIEASTGGAASIFRLKDTYVEPGALICVASAQEESLATAYATLAN